MRMAKRLAAVVMLVVPSMALGWYGGAPGVPMGFLYGILWGICFTRIGWL